MILQSQVLLFLPPVLSFMNKLLISLLLVMSTITHAEITYHLHPPGETIKDEKSPRLIGPFTSRQQCEKKNEVVYKFKGRCHGSFTKLGMPVMQEPEEIERNQTILP